MTTAQIIAAAAAAATLAWPHAATGLTWASGLLRGLRKPAPKKEVDVPTYQEALARIAYVRARLKATDCLGGDESAAIELLTHALVQGSDK